MLTFPIIEHLPVEIFDEIFMGKILHTVDISSATHLPHLVNVVCE